MGMARSASLGLAGGKLALADGEGDGWVGCFLGGGGGGCWMEGGGALCGVTQGVLPWTGVSNGVSSFSSLSGWSSSEDSDGGLADGMAVSSVAASDGAPGWVFRRRCLASGDRLLTMVMKAARKASSSMAMD